MVTDIHPPNSNLKTVVLDFDSKKNRTEDFVTEMSWPDTQYDDEKIKELLTNKET